MRKLLIAALAAAVFGCADEASDENVSEQVTSPSEEAAEPIAEPIEAVQLTAIDKGQACKAAIAAMNGREPETMSAELVEGDLYHVTYVRPEDGTRWQNRCEITSANSLRWAAFDPFNDGSGQGRWRSEDQIRFDLGEDDISVRVSMFGDLVAEETYSRDSLQG